MEDILDFLKDMSNSHNHPGSKWSSPTLSHQLKLNSAVKGVQSR